MRYSFVQKLYFVRECRLTVQPEIYGALTLNHSAAEAEAVRLLVYNENAKTTNWIFC